MHKKLLLATVVLVLCLGGSELTARLVESWVEKPTHLAESSKGWQASLFRLFGGWHESDPELLWRHRANLPHPFRTNSQHYLGAEVPHAKSASAYRILVVGDSTAVGLGLARRKDAFGEVLASMLGSDLASEGRSVELINAAVSGYSSEQVARFLGTQGWSLEPDLVVVYCGNNDASISGPVSDAALMGRQRMTGIRKILRGLALYRVIGMLRASLGERAVTDDPLVVRVAPERYGENLRRMVDQAQERGVPIVLVKPPVPLLWPAGLQFKVLQQLRGEKGELVLPKQMQRILGRKIKYALDYERMNRTYGGTWSPDTRAVYGAAFSDPPSVRNAIAHYARSRDRNPDDPVIRNDLGVSLWQDGQLEAADRELRQAIELFRQFHAVEDDPAKTGAGAAFVFNLGMNTLSRSEQPNADRRLADEAWNLLDQALQDDYFSLRIKRSYLEQFDQFDSTRGVIIIDGPAIFQEHGREELFVDHCHPTAKGQRLIASAIHERIREALGLKGHGTIAR
jgi:lysophospholipase L1-like esterase